MLFHPVNECVVLHLQHSKHIPRRKHRQQSQALPGLASMTRLRSGSRELYTSKLQRSKGLKPIIWLTYPCSSCGIQSGRNEATFVKHVVQDPQMLHQQFLIALKHCTFTRSNNFPMPSYPYPGPRTSSRLIQTKQMILAPFIKNLCGVLQESLSSLLPALIISQYAAVVTL